MADTGAGPHRLNICMESFSGALLRRLLEAPALLLTTHRNADPDGLGSEIALYYLLKTLGKDVLIANPDQAAPRLHFIDPEGVIQVYADLAAHLGERTVVVVDNSDLERILEVRQAIRPDHSNLVIIDHHDGSTPDLKITFQDPTSASTSEIIFQLYKEAQITPSPTAARALYAGLIADTGNFRYRKTTPDSHRMAAQLLELGVLPADISEQILWGFGIKRLELKRLVYSQLGFHGNERIAYFALDLVAENLSVPDLDQLEGVINELLEVQQIQIALLFTRRKSSLTRVSGRSRGDIDLLPAVEAYGGGGHKNACGATIPLDLQDAIHEFLPIVERCL